MIICQYIGLMIGMLVSHPKFGKAAMRFEREIKIHSRTSVPA